MPKSESKKLLQKMKITKSNRFNYAKRLQAKASVKSTVTNLLSVLSIIVSVYLLAYAGSVSADVSRLIGVFIAGVSVVSLLLSLEQPVSVLAKKASDAHRCGRDISQIYRQLQFEVLQVDAAAARYEEIVSQYEDNHDPIDYLMTLYQYREEIPEKAKAVSWFNGPFMYWLSKYSTVFFTIFCLVLVALIWVVMPYLECFAAG
ncbi:SLATT domain-containing protein [Neorhizobium huautlense]|uniref:SLATT domain-containing protein n=1 Tax=Neorhizobium huautlense TaxID=67774 RepID=UPI000CFA3A0D|nr:SLATT domain-containing protein [Neorhizobium huautlense]